MDKQLYEFVKVEAGQPFPFEDGLYTYSPSLGNPPDIYAQELTKGEVLDHDAYFLRPASQGAGRINPVEFAKSMYQHAFRLSEGFGLTDFQEWGDLSETEKQHVIAAVSETLNVPAPHVGEIPGQQEQGEAVKEYPLHEALRKSERGPYKVIVDHIVRLIEIHREFPGMQSHNSLLKEIKTTIEGCEEKIAALSSLSVSPVAEAKPDEPVKAIAFARWLRNNYTPSVRDVESWMNDKTGGNFQPEELYPLFDASYTPAVPVREGDGREAVPDPAKWKFIDDVFNYIRDIHGKDTAEDISLFIESNWPEASKEGAVSFANWILENFAACGNMEKPWVEFGPLEVHQKRQVSTAELYTLFLTTRNQAG